MIEMGKAFQSHVCHARAQSPFIRKMAFCNQAPGTVSWLTFFLGFSCSAKRRGVHQVSAPSLEPNLSGFSSLLPTAFSVVVPQQAPRWHHHPRSIRQAPPGDEAAAPAEEEGPREAGEAPPCPFHRVLFDKHTGLSGV